MFIEINKNYEGASERPVNDTSSSSRQVGQRDRTHSADTSDSDSSPDEPSPACRVDGVYSSGGRACWVWRTGLQEPFTNVQS